METAFDDDEARTQRMLESQPYAVRHYKAGSGPVANAYLDLFAEDSTGERLDREFCKYAIGGTTVAVRARDATMLSLLFDEDSFYNDMGRMSFAAFALVQLEKPVLSVSVLCTSDESRSAKKRYGEALLKSIEAYGKQHGFDAVELDAIDSAVGFYTKMGYSEMGEGDDGVLMRKSLKTGGGRLRLKTLRRSHKKEKKWDAVFEQDGKQKVVPFGQRGYSDFTKHKDTKRRQRYIERHARMGEDWKDPTTPGALSRYILWNKKTLRASLRDFKRKFHV